MATFPQPTDFRVVPEGLIHEGLPLHTFLTDTTPLEGESVSENPLFELTPLDQARSVFLCRDLNSSSRIVCKFFSARPNLPAEEPPELLDYEFQALTRVRSAGLRRSPLRVVRPLGKRESLGCLLTEEYVPGRDLDHFIAEAAHFGGTDVLMEKLELLAALFAHLHRATARRQPHNFTRTCRDFRALIRSLEAVDGMPLDQLSRARHLCDKWENRAEMWSDTSSLIHGDATPTNFIFDPIDGVTAIDFERSHVGDPVHDVGLLVAELKHHFALRIRQAGAAEPFISRFLSCYNSHDSPDAGEFGRLTFRSRFYMAFGELRIARNPWLPNGHRRWLVTEACRCLER